jgi:hypothetical protein
MAYIVLQNIMNITYLLPLTLILFGCAADIRSSDQNAEQWVSEEVGQAAERAGIANQQTYPKIVGNAMKGDLDALSKVFRVSPSTDASASELQAGILVAIIRTIGDAPFADALKKERHSVIAANTYLVFCELGSDTKLYPHTMSLK